MFRLITLVFAILLIPFQVTYAVDTQSYQETTMGWQYFKLFFFLAIILAFIYFLFRFLAKRNGFIRSNVFQLLGGIPLGQNKSVQIVEIGGNIYILGVGQEVRLIQVIEDKEEVQRITDLISTPLNSNDRLIEWFNQLKFDFPPLKRFIKKPNGNKVYHPDSFEELLNQKMTQLKDQRAQTLQEILDTSSETSFETTEKRDSDE
ncbi:flagellar biosynthetic protein FliO [Tepidibacillus marianensis]|uniref:flagellar biosynthetic protein FliO n=1 Tax=Tepidibacillus marianensis TaxID=3131995 RepID=UPI0030D1ED98